MINVYRCMMIKNQDSVLVVGTSINNLDCKVFAVARVNGNMLSPLFTQSMLEDDRTGLKPPSWNYVKVCHIHVQLTERRPTNVCPGPTQRCFFADG